MATIVRTYDYIFNDLADQRVSDWVFMSGPWVPLCIIAIYLYLIYSALPRYMAIRPAFNLKPILMVYNLYQIIICIVLIYGSTTSITGWLSVYSLGCAPIDYSTSPSAMKQASYMYLTSLVKLSEFLETVFFVLRKKDNQVSVLHVYHHALTYLFAWMGVHFGAGGMLWFPIFLNSSVHVIMYTYYLLTSLSSQWQQRLSIVKEYLTRIQMIQLMVIAVHSLQALLPSCNIPAIYAILMIPHITVNAFFFTRFYINNYSNNKDL